MISTGVPVGLKNRFTQLNSLLWVVVMILLTTTFQSCIPHSKIAYLQRDAALADTIQFTRPEYRIKSGDILSIQVLTIDESSYTIFNSDRTTQRTLQSGGGGIGNAQMYLSGYRVDEGGKVRIPVVGLVDVAGRTIEEATREMETRVEEYLIGATVLVKLINFSVTIVGEVRSPGKFYVYDNRISIMDLVAVAGDITDFGNRNVKVVRQTNDGASFGIINLNDAESFRSEYYFLQPNDIVYVEPHKLKRVGISQFPISLVFSTVSLTLLMLSYFR
jgi:polysaccharide biosynthesis/export protein